MMEAAQDVGRTPPGGCAATSPVKKGEELELALVGSRL